MASGFPGSIDSFTNPLTTSPLNSPSHAGQHQDLNDAVNKIETYMGLVKVIPTGATNGTVSADGDVTIGNAVSSVSVSGAFSALYDHYKILIYGTIASSAGNGTLQLSGITGSVYSLGGTFFNYGSAVVSGYGPAATTTWNAIAPIFTSGGSSISIDLFGPNLASNKQMFVQASSPTGYYSFGGACGSTTQATGFVFSSNVTSITGGTIRVYGYRN
jgi:hypothetical protein